MIAAICYSLWSNASEATDGKYVSNASVPQGDFLVGAAAASKSTSTFIGQSSATSESIVSFASVAGMADFRDAISASNQRTVS